MLIAKVAYRLIPHMNPALTGVPIQRSPQSDNRKGGDVGVMWGMAEPRWQLAKDDGEQWGGRGDGDDVMDMWCDSDETVYKELDDRLVWAATTASNLKAKHDSGNIDKTQSKATPNKPVLQELLQVVVSGNILQSDEDSLKLNELMELCTNLQSRVLDLEKTKNTQALEITSLKRRVKKLKKKQRLRTHKLKRLYKVGLTARVDSSKDDQSLGEDASKQGRKVHDIDANEDITLVNDQDDAEMFDVNDLQGEDVFAKKEVADKEVSVAGEVNAASIAITISAAVTITTDEITALFATMLALPAVVEGEGLGNPFESQPTPSLAPPINESQILESSSPTLSFVCILST
nr:hypothetical protein [Tanacetum cinerariifolium]